MWSLAAEIAYVADRNQAARGVLDVHLDRGDGFCGSCGRRCKCDQALAAEGLLRWVQRRTLEINSELDARLDARLDAMLVASVPQREPVIVSGDAFR